jgi:hypothetical protein
MSNRFDPREWNHSKHDQRCSGSDYRSRINGHSLPVNNEKNPMRETEKSKSEENAAPRDEPKSLLNAGNRAFDRSCLMTGHVERHYSTMPSTSVQRTETACGKL